MIQRLPPSSPGVGRRAASGPRRSALAAAFLVLAAALVATGWLMASDSSAAPALTARPSSSSAFAAVSPAQSAPSSDTPAAAPTPTPSPTPTPTTWPHGRAAVLDATTAAALQARLDAIQRSTRVPALTAAVVFPDGRVWTGAAGSAVLAPRQAATDRTLFAIGSITKTFVAALILRLVERGSLALDDALARFMPDFPNAAEITVRQLLSHTSGIEDFFHATGVSESIFADMDHVWTPAELLSRLGKPYFLPGHGYHYSNTNYVILGAIAERVTGKPLATVIREEFLDPLGLHDTYLQSQETPAGELAHAYTGTSYRPYDQTRTSTVAPWVAEVSAVGAAGAIASTASDLARWATALYGGRVLSQASLAAMGDVSLTSEFKPLYPYGLGFEQYQIAGELACGHRGHLDGFWSMMAYLPGERLTVVVLTNADWGKVTRPAQELANIALGLKPSASASPAASGR